ncbi:MAG: uracil-DNA glycosylase family protein [Alphaproteobacteria bacterium]|nr:uracil-DNA glycosylase family protein [Alphaproteobacteria bacterium]
MAPLLDRIAQEAARGGLDIDRPAYEEAGRDPLEPVLLGSGDLSAPLGFFGRDPGRTEIELGEPFIGRGGRLIRDGLHRAVHGEDAPDLAAACAIGERVFWGNTVPYKPTGNKAWSVSVKRRFVPMIRELLVQRWQGQDLITLGNVAFDWFRLADKQLTEPLREFWEREDRYEASLEIRLAGKRIRLHPLPHPSPLNATWFPRFPGLLDARLQALGWTGEPRP